MQSSSHRLLHSSNNDEKVFVSFLTVAGDGNIFAATRGPSKLSRPLDCCWYSTEKTRYIYLQRILRNALWIMIPSEDVYLYLKYKYNTSKVYRNTRAEKVKRKVQGVLQSRRSQSLTSIVRGKRHIPTCAKPQTQEKFVYLVCESIERKTLSHLYRKKVQPNFDGSNLFGTMKICSRYG